MARTGVQCKHSHRPRTLPRGNFTSGLHSFPAVTRLACATIFTSLPNRSRTKKRRTPHGLRTGRWVDQKPTEYARVWTSSRLSASMGRSGTGIPKPPSAATLICGGAAALRRIGRDPTEVHHQPQPQHTAENPWRPSGRPRRYSPRYASTHRALVPCLLQPK